MLSLELQAASQTTLLSREVNEWLWQAPEGQLLSFKLGFQEIAWEDALQA
jgi:hypothetical protein